MGIDNFHPVRFIHSGEIKDKVKQTQNNRGQAKIQSHRYSYEASPTVEPVLRREPPHGSLIQCCKYDQYGCFQNDL